MKIQSTQQNNNLSFQAMTITPEAKILIKKQKGGLKRINNYTKELANSKLDLTLGSMEINGKEKLVASFGRSGRCGAITPAHLKDNYVMVYSANKYGDDDIVDCLKFKNSHRAEQVYKKLESFYSNGPEIPVIKQFDSHVYATKLFDEAKVVPQKDSPWAMWIQENTTKPIINKNTNKASSFNEEKTSFMQKLKEAWKILTK